jgi:hypothetical protein
LLPSCCRELPRQAIKLSGHLGCVSVAPSFFHPQPDGILQPLISQPLLGGLEVVEPVILANLFFDEIGGKFGEFDVFKLTIKCGLNQPLGMAIVHLK